jgi:hypothetical protein
LNTKIQARPGRKCREAGVPEEKLKEMLKVR